MLNAVIKETTRILPVAPYGGSRYIMEDFEVPYADQADGGKGKVARFRKGWVVLFGRGLSLSKLRSDVAPAVS